MTALIAALASLELLLGQLQTTLAAEHPTITPYAENAILAPIPRNSTNTLPIPQNPEIPLEKSKKPLSQGQIRSIIAEEARQYGISEVFALELAFIESRYDPFAKNPVSSARGIYQFVNGTWNERCAGERTDPRDNTRCAMKLLANGELYHWTVAPETRRKLQGLGWLDEKFAYILK